MRRSLRGPAAWLALAAVGCGAPTAALDTAAPEDPTLSSDPTEQGSHGQDDTDTVAPPDEIPDPLVGAGSLVADDLAELRGLALRDASGFGLVGLDDGVQAFHVTAGLGDVFDLLPGAEDIVSSRLTPDGAWCLGVVGDDGAAVVDGGTLDVMLDVEGAGLRGFLVDDAGAVAIRNVGDEDDQGDQDEDGDGQGAACEVSWTPLDDPYDVTAVDVPWAVCEAVAVAALPGALYASADGALWRVDADGATSIEMTADVLVADVFGRQVLAASDDTLLAIAEDGSVAWRVTLPGRVQSLDVLGAAGGVAVLLAGDAPGVALVDNGELTGWHEVNGGGEALVASEDGALLALVSSPVVEFFSLSR